MADKRISLKNSPEKHDLNRQSIFKVINRSSIVSAKDSWWKSKSWSNNFMRHRRKALQALRPAQQNEALAAMYNRAHGLQLGCVSRKHYKAVTADLKHIHHQSVTEEEAWLVPDQFAAH